jgi:putative spermidine/putrescine transport system ATP-binding protein
VAGVDLDVADGEFFCMLGPSGSGKTTVLRLLAGFEQPTAGSIELAGRDVTRTPPFERDVNTVFQDYALFPHLSVAQNIGYGLAVRHVPRRERGLRVDEALASVRLEGFGGRRPSQLSGGQRQRVALARALVNRPRVLLLDEPLGALDLKLRQEMQLELKQLQRDVGITFLFVTHDQDEALTMSDRIAVFAGGRIEQVGLPHSVYEHPANEFVATFVGTTNLLGGEAARAVLGQNGTWSVRPERLRVDDLSAPVAPDEQSGEGTLRDLVYAGAVTRLVVDLDAGVPLVAAVPGGGALPVGLARGRRVRVVWRREHALRVG